MPEAGMVGGLGGGEQKCLRGSKVRRGQAWACEE